jgi:hypothetical protein
MALTVELSGCSVRQRGGELLAISAAEELRQRFPDVQLIVPPAFGPFAVRARHGFLTTWEMPTGIRTKTILRFAPKPLKRAAGIVDPSCIQYVLDFGQEGASARYSSSQPAQLLQKLDRRDRRRQGLILMPQRFAAPGSAAETETQRLLVKRAALVFARELSSFEAIAPLCPEPKLHLAPDLTCTAEPVFPRHREFPLHFSAVVLNARAFTGDAARQTYYRQLEETALLLMRKKLNPVFILQGDTMDPQVISVLRSHGVTLPEMEFTDPRHLKSVLGRATVVVGSDYTTLLSALSQGVPSMAIGAPSVAPLFNDFGCPELLTSDSSTIAQVFEPLLHNESRQKFHRTLLESRHKQMAMAVRAWQTIHQQIETRQSQDLDAPARAAIRPRPAAVRTPRPAS